LCSYLLVVICFAVATCISFLPACFFVSKSTNRTLRESQKEKDLLKNKVTDPKKIVFACQAGMGSSAMGAAAFRKRVDQPDLSITNAAVNAIPPDTDIVVCQATFVSEAKHRVPSAEIVIIETFLS